MHIIIFNWRDIRNPLSGGAEIVTHEYARGWVKAGHSVVVICPAYPNSPKQEIIDGVEYLRLGLNTSWNYLLIHILAFFHYRRFLIGKIDLVIDQVHWVPFFTPLYVREKNLVFIHEVAKDIWIKQFGFIGVIGKMIEPLFYLPYRKIKFLTISPSTKLGLIRMGINKSQITVIKCGTNQIPLTKVPEKEKILTIISLGRIAPVKNIEATINIFNIIKKRLGKATLWIVGRNDNKTYWSKIKRQIESLSLQNDIKFWGYVSDAEKINLLKKSHFLLHTSIVEGWGLVVIEANAMATPVIGFNTPGLSDSIINGKTGFLIPKNNLKQSAEIIIRLYKNKRLYKLIQKRSLDSLDQYSWRKAVSRSLHLIEKM